MNLILLFKRDFISKNTARLTGRRHKHIVEHLHSKIGDELCVGLVNGKIGIGKITKFDHEAAELKVKTKNLPPKPLPLTLVVALARPNVFKRVLLSASSLGIKNIFILNFNRVEKSLWQSSALQPEAIEEQLVLGLEQARDTVMPTVELRKRFKPFVEDELPELIKGKLALVAHPDVKKILPSTKSFKSIVLVVGPEGGIIPYELQQLEKLGVIPFSLGERILRVETVIPYILGKLARNTQTH